MPLSLACASFGDHAPGVVRGEDPPYRTSRPLGPPRPRETPRRGVAGDALVQVAGAQLPSVIAVAAAPVRICR